MRLIDADELMERLLEIRAEYEHGAVDKEAFTKQEMRQECFDAVCACIDAVNDARDEDAPARLMTLEEVLEIYKLSRDHIWPYNTPPYLFTQENHYACGSSGAWFAWREIKSIIHGELFGHSIETYGKTWRCWTKWPTDEQREAAKWDE